MIEIVCATRRSPQAFARRSPLGRSLARWSDARLSSHVAYRNTRGLAEVYNARITASGGADVLVFVHDDVWIDDPFPADSLLRGLSKFDVIGVAGNRRRVPGQVSWAFVDGRFRWDDAANLSGAVAHRSGARVAMSRYGDAPARCELLDGVLLAARRTTLERRGVLFDPRFRFHFYDLDFCRTARARGLTLGTWPIAITHASGGELGSPEWKREREKYRRKWRDAPVIRKNARAVIVGDAALLTSSRQNG
jgi:hypothetical protein